MAVVRAAGAASSNEISSRSVSPVTRARRSSHDDGPKNTLRPSPKIPGPAVALIELESIARGMVTADVVLKRADVQIAIAEPTTPGKYVLLFSGEVADVEEAYAAAIDFAGPLVLDQLLLTYAHEALVDGLRDRFANEWQESVGIVETHTVAAALLAVDTAMKRADVRLMHLHLARGIGGKGYFVLTGSLHMMEAALESVRLALAENLLLTTELIQNPHPELLKGPAL